MICTKKFYLAVDDVNEYIVDNDCQIVDCETVFRCSADTILRCMVRSYIV